MNIAIIDYGVGNLASVVNALRFIGAAPDRAHEPDALTGAGAIVIPGVGHFAATAELNRRWRDAIATAIGRNIPILGICLGMQWLFDGSAEAPEVAGFGALRGMCAAINAPVKVPHVGWNTLDRSARPSVLLEGIDDGAAAYFTHSYVAPVTDDTAASTTHGCVFASVVERGSVFGVQWHPEKSGAIGLALLSNFVRLAEPSSC